MSQNSQNNCQNSQKNCQNSQIRQDIYYIYIAYNRRYYLYDKQIYNYYINC